MSWIPTLGDLLNRTIQPLRLHVIYVVKTQDLSQPAYIRLQQFAGKDKSMKNCQEHIGPLIPILLFHLRPEAVALYTRGCHFLTCEEFLVQDVQSI